jgi:hypothetical protein
MHNQCKKTTHSKRFKSEVAVGDLSRRLIKKDGS